MKQIIALVLAAALFSAQTVPARAAEQPTYRNIGAEQLAMGNGKVELFLKLALPLEQGGLDNDIKAVLSGANGESQTIHSKDTVAFDLQGNLATDRKVERRAFNFQELAPGNYTLTVSGVGMKPFTQAVAVASGSISKLTIDNLSHLQTGDVDGDGGLSAQDKNAIIRAMSATNTDTTPATDLNGDGKTNILDLSYFHYSSKAVQSAVTVSSLSAGTKDGTTVEGDLLDLLNKTNTDPVKLTPKNTTASISKSNAVTVELVTDAVQASGIVIALPASGNAPATGTVTVEFADGSLSSTDFAAQTPKAGRSIFGLFSQKSETAVVKNNTIAINLGTQKAVKRVTITVTGTAGNTNLAEISKVEFLGDMADHIPPPQMNIPSPLKAQSGNKSFSLSWPAQQNVTGYEVRVSTKKDANAFITAGQYESIPCGGNTAVVNRYAKDELKNGTPYYAVVQSVNGSWSSGFSEVVQVIPKATTPPDAPGNILVVPGYRELNLSWSAPEDADGYTLYYKKAGAADFVLAGTTTTTNYTLAGLEDKTKYILYLTAYNDKGTGKRSSEVSGETIDLAPPVTTNYKLLNTSNGFGVTTNHIQKVEVNRYAQNAYPNGFNPFFVVDSDYTSHWTDAAGNSFNGPIVTFDQPYAMDKVIFSTRMESGFTNLMSDIAVVVWESETAQPKTFVIDGNHRTDLSTGTYEVRFPVQTVKKIQVKFQRYYAGVVSMSELKFYHYDSLEDDVDGLFTDALHIKLRPDVAAATIDALEARANTVDTVSTEYHPKRATILQELNRARDLLSDPTASDVITVDQTVSNSRNGHLGFSYNMNDWQPLGIVAKAGEELSVYVGKTGKTLPKLVFSQHYPEHTHLMKEFPLVEGKNVITVPKLGDIDSERGGSVYVRYPNNEPSGEIQVRVSGGSPIPVLDLHGLTDSTEITKRIGVYVAQLQAQVASLPQSHQAAHQSEGYNYSYDERLCILNTTEIVLNDVLLTIPATQALDSIGGIDATAEALEARLYDGTLALGEMMDLFYKEKGLVPYGTAGREKDWKPSSRINMRYTRMLNGAFMYAAGWHMGIEYNSSKLLGGSPMKFVDGKPQDYQDSFGWGIAHEVGHIIDQKGMVWGEVTNNLFPLLLQTRDDLSPSRIESADDGYSRVYQKVTSGQRSKTADGFTAMGMYWQLHLAFDDKPTWDNTVTDTFYAKLSRLYRSGAGASLTNEDDRLICLASDASGYDLREFFERWGLPASAAVNTYLDGKGYGSPGAIYYLNDQARRYRIGGGQALPPDTQVAAEISNDEGSREVHLALGVSGVDAPMLGYEIRRNDVAVGFVAADASGQASYTDIISSANNTVFTYQVVGYDYLLNPTEKTAPVSLKISHDGSMDKRYWKASTNTTFKPDGQEDDPCGLKNPEINRVIDYDPTTVFEGVTSGANAQITLDMGGIQPAVGLKYSGSGIVNCEIAVSKDGKAWTTVRTDSLGGSDTVFFAAQDGDLTTDPAHPWVYQSGYVRLTAKDSKTITVGEIDVIAPAGDNISFLDTGSVGLLEEEFIYGDQPEDRIPAGAVVVTGKYRGNPAYNTMLLKDEKDHTINGKEIIFAEIPDTGDILDVQEGIWVFWVTDGVNALTSKVKAQLYRTDNALTNGGQRMVSDTLYLPIPTGDLPSIKLTSDSTAAPAVALPPSSEEPEASSSEAGSVSSSSESGSMSSSSDASSVPSSSEASSASSSNEASSASSNSETSTAPTSPERNQDEDETV